MAGRRVALALLLAAWRATASDNEVAAVASGSRRALRGQAEGSGGGWPAVKYVNSPKAWVDALDWVLQHPEEKCSVTYRVKDELFGTLLQVGVNDTNPNLGGSSPFTWTTNYKGLELTLNEYCCGLPVNATLDQRTAVCTCSLANAVSFPILPDITLDVIYVVGRGLPDAPRVQPPVFSQRLFNQSRVPQQLSLRNHPFLDDLLQKVFDYTFKTESLGDTSWAPYGPATRKDALYNNVTLNCSDLSLRQRLLMTMKSSVGYCRWVDAPRADGTTVADQTGCLSCKHAFESQRSAAQFASCSNVKWGPEDLDPRSICQDLDVTLAFIYGIAGASAFFNVPDLTKTACGAPQVPIGPNLLLRDYVGGQAEAQIKILSSSNAAWKKGFQDDNACATFFREVGMTRGTQASNASGPCPSGTPAQRGEFFFAADYDYIIQLNSSYHEKNIINTFFHPGDF